MSLRARIFIIVSVVVLLILGISIFLVVSNKNKSNQPQNTTSSQNQTVNNPVNTQNSVTTQIPNGLPAKTATPLEAEKNGVVQLAKVFVERYGTYSTDNNYQNIKEVQSLVTASLWSKISASMTASTSNQAFVGVTTKAISMDLTSWTDTQASVTIKTSRVQEKNGTVTTIYQTADVTLIKQGNNWLVDKLVWQ